MSARSRAASECATERTTIPGAAVAHQERAGSPISTSMMLGTGMCRGVAKWGVTPLVLPQT